MSLQIYIPLSEMRISQSAVMIMTGKLKNEKGSALLVVLIAISFLAILGVSLLTFSTATFTRAAKLTGANKAFYLTDGAIEESLAEINDMAFDAEAQANNHVVEAFDFEKDNIFEAIDDGSLDGVFLSNDTWKAFLRKLRIDMNNEVITEEEAMEYIEIGLKCEFLLAYYESLLDSGKASLTYTLLDDDGNYYDDPDETDAYVEESIVFEKIDSDALSNSRYTTLNTLQLNAYIDNVSGFEKENSEGAAIDNLTMTAVESSFTEDEGITITLKTDGSFNEHKRALELKVKVTEPKYQYVFKSAQGTETIKNNEATDYAIIAGKDIIVSEGHVDIFGDAYAYGTFPDAEDTKTQKQVGGIHLGYKDETDNFLNDDMSGFLYESMLSLDGSLSVDGNLYTRSNIKIFEAGNTLKVTKNMGANEFRTNGYTTGADSTDITIDGNMYLYEDIILRGSHGTTNIKVGADSTTDGDLFLILDSSGNGYTSGDQSGSIIIEDGIQEKINMDVNKLFISGLSFAGISRMVEVDGEDVRQYFMTGESLSIENKYMKFYESSYAADNNYADKLGNYEDVTYYYDYEDGEPIDTSGNVTTIGYDYIEPTDESNDFFKQNAFMMGATSGDSSSSATEVDDIDKKMLKIRSLTTTDAYEDNYATGVVLGMKADETGGVLNPEYSMSIANYKTMLRSTLLNANVENHGRDVDRLMNLIATRDISEGKTFIYSNDVVNGAGETVLNKAFNTTRLSQMIDFTQDIIKFDDYENVRIVNEDVNSDIYINPPGAIDSNDIAIGGSSQVLTEIGGTIATRGDVYIYTPVGSQFTYNGTILAEGRVIFYGQGTKVIQHDKDIINYQIAAYSDMGSAFYKDEGRTIENVLGHIPENTALIDLFDLDNTNVHFTCDGLSPVIAVIPTGESITVRLDQPPILAGMQKNEGIKGYEVEYWRETR